MAVQGLFETLLIDEVRDEPDGAPHHEERVERSALDVLLCETKRKAKMTGSNSHFHNTHPRAPRTFASSLEKTPLLLMRSTKTHAMAPSTLRMRLDFFLLVTASTCNAKSKIPPGLRCSRAKRFTMETRASRRVRGVDEWCRMSQMVRRRG